LDDIVSAQIDVNETLTCFMRPFHTLQFTVAVGEAPTNPPENLRENEGDAHYQVQYQMTGFRLTRAHATDPMRFMTVTQNSQLYRLCQELVLQRGSWVVAENGLQPRPLIGYNLVQVDAVIHDCAMLCGFKSRRSKLTRLNSQQTIFSPELGAYEFEQAQIWDLFQGFMHARNPADDVPYSPGSFYCFHGPKFQYLESICRNGMVGVRELDGGYFGAGCYSTLNVEYAIRYAAGEFDDPARANDRQQPSGDRRAIVLMCGLANKSYPVTPTVDYETQPPHSDFYGRPLKCRGYDCHVACVSEDSQFEAVEAENCQFVEVVVEQEIQYLPLAVLYFQEV
jgi:hypothetical protein